MLRLAMSKRTASSGVLVPVFSMDNVDYPGKRE
jgi:hypothetical protein